MSKVKVKVSKSNGAQIAKQPTQIVVDSEEADDWIRTLPGYRESEAAIHDELSKKYGTKQPTTSEE